MPVAKCCQTCGFKGLKRCLFKYENANENTRPGFCRSTALLHIHLMHWGNKPESSRGWHSTSQTEGVLESKTNASPSVFCFSTSVTVFDTVGHTYASLTLLMTHFKTQHCVKLAFPEHPHSCFYIKCVFFFHSRLRSRWFLLTNCCQRSTECD